MKKNHVLVIPLLCIGVSLQAAPPPGTGTLSFAQARERIIANNTGLKAVATETRAAEAYVSQAGVRPNPVAGIALDKFGANEIEATIGQTFELGDKRRLRAAVARRDVDVSVNAGEQFRFDLESEIVKRFIPIDVAAKKIALLDSIIAATESTRAQLQKRAEVGAAKKSDLIRVEIELEKLSLDQGKLVREKELARHRFAALGGKNEAGLMDVAGVVDDGVELPSLEQLDAALKNSPYVKAAEIACTRLDAQKVLLKAEVKPDLEVTIGYLRNNIDPYNAPLAGVSLNVPIFNKNIAAQQQVELQKQATGERREEMLRLLDAEIRSIYGSLLDADKKIHILTSSTIPKAEEVYAMTLEYYDAGNTGFLDLAAARAEMLRLWMDILDIRTERALHLAELMQMTTLNIPIVK